jgi:hypothetical protein
VTLPTTLTRHGYLTHLFRSFYLGFSLLGVCEHQESSPPLENTASVLRCYLGWAFRTNAESHLRQDQYLWVPFCIAVPLPLWRSVSRAIMGIRNALQIASESGTASAQGEARVGSEMHIERSARNSRKDKVTSSEATRSLALSIQASKRCNVGSC